MKSNQKYARCSLVATLKDVKARLRGEDRHKRKQYDGIGARVGNKQFVVVDGEEDKRYNGIVTVGEGLSLTPP